MQVKVTVTLRGVKLGKISLAQFLKNLVSQKNFIIWVKILLSNNQSCVLNNGKVTDFFNIERGTKQGDPISPYIFTVFTRV